MPALQLFGCYHDTISLNLDTRHTSAIPEGERPRLTEITINPATGASNVRQLTPTVGDFPIINPNYTGRKNRYAYVACMVTDARAVKWDGVAKVDLQAPIGTTDAVISKIQMQPGCHNGETVFVPR